eukprot:CAMPEP_0179122674 /NCGR_PEP_ID=MMETSP0796-20121207/57906_1 /TAXON_ID=73915 /ORGANISM="Pyrodinium bahamense, Strain pbaha01" /LENGTH=141 /DNA_ID=CAMNT_0020821301 /DNA_START=329 /DNA_END=754 /DNA_ORIENTATION=+
MARTLRLCSSKPSVKMCHECTQLVTAGAWPRSSSSELRSHTGDGRTFFSRSASRHRGRQPHQWQWWNPRQGKTWRPLAHHDELDVLLGPPAEGIAQLEYYGLDLNVYRTGTFDSFRTCEANIFGGVEVTVKGPSTRSPLQN